MIDLRVMVVWLIVYGIRNSKVESKEKIKKVLVTGSVGYIGSVLISQLLYKNYNVFGLDSLSVGGESLLEVCNHPQFTFVKGDLRDKKFSW